MTLRTKSEILYYASSLEEVAEFFLQRATTFDDSSNNTRSRYLAQGQRWAWKEAAKILKSLQIEAEDEIDQYERVDPSAELS